MSNHGDNDLDLEGFNVTSEHASKMPANELNDADAVMNSTVDGVSEHGHFNGASEFQKQQQHIGFVVQHDESVTRTTGMPTVPEMPSDWIDSLLPVPTLDPRTDIRANAFAQFVQGWENYMNDDGLIDPFPNFQQPLQMLQDLSLCGHPAILPRLEANNVVNAPLAVHPVAPSVLRYTYSSPSQIHGRKSSVYESSLTGFNGNQINDPFPPPPVALDPFQRSSSTPSAFRQHTSSSYSAFGTRDRSAFTTTSRFNDFVPVGRESSCFSLFGPVDFYSMALEDMERTSIEVQDISDCIANTSASNVIEDKVGSKRGAASRAAKFLKDIRVLRRRRKFRGGRENPVQPTLDTTFGSKNSDDDVAIGSDQYDCTVDTAVTVFTETMFNPNDSSFLSGSSELAAIAERATDIDGVTDVEDILLTSPSLNVSPHEDATDEAPEREQQYQQLDSDIEEEVGYQRIETQLQSTSPPLVEMKDRIDLLNSVCRPGESINTIATSTETAPIKVQVSTVQKPRFAMSMEGTAASPSPTQMDIGEGSNLTPLSHESIDSSLNTTRSVSSSGHTTQATLPSNSTGQQSGLSTISETDREVMEANKDAKRRRGLDSLVKKYNKAETDGSSNNSSSSNSTNPHRYFSLSGSPDVLREGAVVPIDRFFMQPSPSLLPIGQPATMARANTTSTSSGSRRSESTNSPTTTVSIPVTHASSSSASSREEPPTFVSYVGQEMSASKLIAFREENESSPQRTSGKDLEEREASPAAEIMEFRKFALDEITAPSQVRGSRLGLTRRQQRPPRFPPKGLHSTKTPPPFDAVSPLRQETLSPPRKIVDLPISNLSRPMVLRSSSDPLPSVSHSHRLNADDVHLLPIVEHISPNVAKSRTYHERNVEVMDASSREEVEQATTFVSPEKC